jgi:hypothetical protein
MRGKERIISVLSLSLSQGRTRMENHTRINAGKR